MGYRICFLALVLVLAFCRGSAADYSSCLIVDPQGAEHRIPSWSRFVVREIDPSGDRGAQAGEGLSSPAALTALVYRGAVIPVENLRFLLPALGIYALEDGYLIEAYPLSECAFSREHRLIDVEHSRYRSTASGIGTEVPAEAPLRLEVSLEYADVDTVAGYSVSEPRMFAIQDARVVALDPKSVDQALELWAARAGRPAVGARAFPYAIEMGKGSSLRTAPDGEEAGQLKKGATVEVLGARGDWARVRVEGWVKKDTVEEKKR